jgi:hypothetical protein
MLFFNCMMSCVFERCSSSTYSLGWEWEPFGWPNWTLEICCTCPWYLANQHITSAPTWLSHLASPHMPDNTSFLHSDASQKVSYGLLPPLPCSYWWSHQLYRLSCHDRDGGICSSRHCIFTRLLISQVYTWNYITLPRSPAHAHFMNFSSLINTAVTSSEFLPLNLFHICTCPQAWGAWIPVPLEILLPRCQNQNHGPPMLTDHDSIVS